MNDADLDSEMSAWRATLLQRDAARASSLFEAPETWVERHETTVQLPTRRYRSRREEADDFLATADESAVDGKCIFPDPLITYAYGYTGDPTEDAMPKPLEYGDFPSAVKLGLEVLTRTQVPYDFPGAYDDEIITYQVAKYEGTVHEIVPTGSGWELRIKATSGVLRKAIGLNQLGLATLLIPKYKVELDAGDPLNPLSLAYMGYRNTTWIVPRYDVYRWQMPDAEGGASAASIGYTGGESSTNFYPPVKSKPIWGGVTTIDPDNGGGVVVSFSKNGQSDQADPTGVQISSRDYQYDGDDGTVLTHHVVRIFEYHDGE